MANEIIHASQVLLAGSWNPNEASDRISLDYDNRHRRRFRFVAAGGTEFLLDLARVTVLAQGDGLLLDDGRIIAVDAAPELLTEIRAASPAELVRLAWHIGNRHLPAQLLQDRILIREDYVISDMLRGLGAELRTLNAPFTPESGAYSGGGHGGGHSHGHEPAERYVFAPGHGH